MALTRVFAYEVEPQRTASSPIAPVGGRVVVNAAIAGALQSASNTARLSTQTTVDLRVDPTSRTSIVRDALLSLGFGSDPDSLASAGGLAGRLAGVMDRRSKSCLFLLASEEAGNTRRITLWTFPKDESFLFQTAGAGQASLTLSNEAFSRTSRLRKAALFEGENIRTHFLNGRVLDLQLGMTEVADYWIEEFLEAAFGITPEQGTRLLGGTIRKTWERADGAEQREQLFAAMTAVRHSPRRRWSLQTFADEYLTGDLKQSFIEAAPNADALTSNFDLEPEVFDKVLQFRVFQLDNQVFVSSPFSEVGRSVLVSGGAQLDPGASASRTGVPSERRLTVEGVIVDERITTRRA